ncbi:MAG: hypothetical protein AAB728_05465, partial [Patescibacteria group bacterium]
NLLGKTVEDIVINKTHGTVQLTGTGTTDSLLVSSGTLDFNGKAITTVGNVTIGTTGQVNPRGLPGSVITVGGNMSLTGETNDKLNLSATGSWTLTVNGASAVARNVTVANANAGAGREIDALGGSNVNGGGNNHWNFGRGITGFLYSDEGVTPLSGRTIAVSVNGGAAAGTGATAGDGSFSLYGVNMTGGSVVTLYADGGAEDAVTVVLASGATMSGISLYQNRLITMSQSGSAAVDNAILGVASLSASSDTDISAIFSVASGNLTVASGKELLVWANDTFAPGGQVTATDYDINGTMTLGANAFTVNGSFDATGGTFTTSGTATFAATAAGKTVTTNGNAFGGTVTFNGTGGGWTLQDNLTASGVTVSVGTLVDNGMTVRVDGSISIANAASLLTSTGIWEMSADANVSNPYFHSSKFNVLRVGTGVTVTRTGNVNAKSLVMGANALMQGSSTLYVAYPTADDFLQLGAGADIASGVVRM